MESDLTKDPQVRRLWNAYARAARAKRTKFTVFSLGDTPELADELLALVLAGTKRAHTSLPSDFAASGRPTPKAGDFGIIIDGSRKPRCIIRSVRVDVKPMRDVDATFAWENGGGDRSLDWWLSAYARYFRRQATREGFAFDSDTALVLDRFEVVWPPEFADVRTSSEERNRATRRLP